MPLHMPTISAVTILVTATLGFILVLAWLRERTSPLIGWWGVSQLVMAAGIVIAVIAVGMNSANLHAFGQSWMILSGALMWMAARQFEGRPAHFAWVVAVPVGFLAAQLLGVFGSFDNRLIVACAVLAILSFAAAAELAHDGSESLSSRWSAVAVLIAMGIGYLAWLPLTMLMPVREAGLIFASAWFPVVVLIALLARVALAFLVLAIAKERSELAQRIDAMTDPLTGLANRRALFDAAEQLTEHSKYLKGDPIAVLVFDLDHFKKVNDTYGHRLGDRVLQHFADVMDDQLETGSIVGRLGGEEFAAILPGANVTKAAIAAEGVRVAFETSASVLDGVPVSCTVSVGVAASDDIDCDLAMLFHKADAALYMAKNAGRNRVELIGPHELLSPDGPIEAAVFAKTQEKREQTLRARWSTMRRYRGAHAAGLAPRRGPRAFS